MNPTSGLPLPNKSLLVDWQPRITASTFPLLDDTPVAGGNGGTPFSDLSYVQDHFTQTYISAIKVSYGGGVDRIQVMYDGTKWANAHGGDAGSSDLKEDIFTLRTQEYITKIEGRAGTKLDQIKFHTSMGHASTAYGGNGGDAFAWSGTQLVYLSGSSGDQIDSLQGHFFATPNPHDPTQTVVVSSVVGGTGGTPFSDFSFVKEPRQSNISAIKISSLATVARIQVMYDGNTWANIHGGNVGGSGMQDVVFYLLPNEYITEIEGRSGSRIDRIKFYTNFGRASAAFGGNGGKPFVWSGQKLVYFSGNSDDTQICNLQGHFLGTLSSLAVPTDSLPTGITIQGLSRASAAGGRGGHAFSDASYIIDKDPKSAFITAIKVRHGGVVDSLQVQYDGTWAPQHGGGGGREDIFALQPGEVVTTIEGRSASAIDQLRFSTNFGRFSGRYGGSGGAPFIWSGSKLACFSGQSGSRLDSLQAHWFA